MQRLPSARTALRRRVALDGRTLPRAPVAAARVALGRVRARLALCVRAVARRGAAALPRLCWDWGSPLLTSALALGLPRHICAGTGAHPHLLSDWAHHCHIWEATGLAPATSAPELGSPPPTSELGLCSPLPHPHGDWVVTGLTPTHICTGTGLTPAHIRTCGAAGGADRDGRQAAGGAVPAVGPLCRHGRVHPPIRPVWSAPSHPGPPPVGPLLPAAAALRCSRPRARARARRVRRALRRG